MCDYDKIFEVVNSKKYLFKPEGKYQKALGRVAIMADTAHAFGAKWHGKMTGCVADFSSFSFHAVKNLTTGEGGAVSWKNIKGIDNDDLYKKYIFPVTGIPSIKVPSTSPANAAWSLERLCRDWGDALAPFLPLLDPVK